MGVPNPLKAQSSYTFCLMLDTVTRKTVHSLWRAQASFTEAARQKANLSAQSHCFSWISFKCKMKTNSHTQEAAAANCGCQPESIAVCFQWMPQSRKLSAHARSPFQIFSCNRVVDLFGVETLSLKKDKGM